MVVPPAMIVLGGGVLDYRRQVLGEGSAVGIAGSGSVAPSVHPGCTVVGWAEGSDLTGGVID